MMPHESLQQYQGQQYNSQMVQNQYQQHSNYQQPIQSQPYQQQVSYSAPVKPINAPSLEEDLENIKKSASNNSDNFNIDYDKLKKHQTGTIAADYFKLCELSIAKNINVLHNIYIHLPSSDELRTVDGEHMVVSLFFMAYMTIAEDFCMKYESLEDFIMVLCIIIVRRNTNLMVVNKLRRSFASVTKNINKFSIKKTGTFKLPKSIKSKPTKIEKTDKNGDCYNHLIFTKLEWLDKSIMNLGEFFKTMIPLDFLPMHCSIRSGLVKKYSNDNTNVTEVGVHLEARIKTFIVTNVKFIKEFEYTNIEDRIAKNFINFIEDVITGKKVQRFRLNSLKNKNTMALETLDVSKSADVNIVQFAIIDNMSFCHINSSKHERTDISNQCFPTQLFTMKQERYTNIKNHKPVMNSERCMELSLYYNIPFDDDVDDDHGDKEDSDDCDDFSNNNLSGASDENEEKERKANGDDSNIVGKNVDREKSSEMKTIKRRESDDDGNDDDDDNCKRVKSN